MTEPVSTSTPHRSAAEHPRVSGRALLVGLITAVVLYAVGIVLLVSVPEDQPVAAGIAQYLVSGLAPLGGALAAARVGTPALSSIGWRRARVRWLLVAVPVGVGVVLLGMLSTTAVITFLGPDTTTQSDYRAAATGGTVALLLTLVAGAVVAPLGEESLFRGVLAGYLGRFGALVQVLGSAVLFALAHGISYVTPLALLVGLSAALLYRRTRSIWPGVVVHATNNTAAVLLPVLVALPR